MREQKGEGNQRIGHALDIYAAPYIKSAASTGRILIRSAGAAPFWRDICEEVTACISLSLICYLFYYFIYANLRSSCESVLLSLDSAVQLVLCKRLGDNAQAQEGEQQVNDP